MRKRMRIGNGVERLDPRQLAASLLYDLGITDMFGDPIGDTVAVGDQIEVAIQVQANYDEGELPFGKVGGVFAYGADLLFNDQTLAVIGIEQAPHFLTAASPGDIVPVDDIGTSMVDDIGGVLSGVTLDQIHTTDGELVDVAIVTFEVLDSPGMFTGVSLEVSDVDGFFQSLAIGIDEPVDAVLGENTFWLGQVEHLPVALPDLHNEDMPSDVNEDGVVTPLDMLLVVNDMYLVGARTIEDAVANDTVPSAKIDVNDNGTIGEGVDALIVMAVLNEQSFDPDVPTDPPVDPGWDCEVDGNAVCDIYEKV